MATLAQPSLANSTQPSGRASLPARPLTCQSPLPQRVINKWRPIPVRHGHSGPQGCSACRARHACRACWALPCARVSIYAERVPLQHPGLGLRLLGLLKLAHQPHRLHVAADPERFSSRWHGQASVHTRCMLLPSPTAGLPQHATCPARRDVQAVCATARFTAARGSLAAAGCHPWQAQCSKPACMASAPTRLAFRQHVPVHRPEHLDLESHQHFAGHPCTADEGTEHCSRHRLGRAGQGLMQSGRPSSLQAGMRAGGRQARGKGSPAPADLHLQAKECCACC